MYKLAGPSVIAFATMCLVTLFACTACAIHYYDEETGVEHIWGVGHLKMKSSKPNEGLQAVVHGSDVFGLSIGKADKQSYFTAGWQRLQFIDILKESTSIRLEWPDSSFANVRVGSRFPLDIPGSRAKGEKRRNDAAGATAVKDENQDLGSDAKTTPGETQ